MQADFRPSSSISKGSSKIKIEKDSLDSVENSTKGTDVFTKTEPIVRDMEKTLQFEEVTMIDRDSGKSVKIKLNPFSNTAPLDILERPRRRPTTTGVTVFPAANTVNSFDPFAEVISNNTNQRFMDVYSYVRTDVKVRFEPRVNPFTYGLALIAWAYGNEPATTSQELIPMQSYILDLSTSEGLEFIIPYNYAADYLPTSYPTGQRHGAVATVYYTLLGVNTITPGGDTSYEAMTFLQMTNTEVVGMVEGQASREIIPMYADQHVAAPEVHAMVGPAMITTGALALNGARSLISSIMGTSSIETIDIDISSGVDAVSKMLTQQKRARADQTSVKQSAFGELADIAPSATGAGLAMYNDLRLVEPDLVGDTQARHCIKDIVSIPSGPLIAPLITAVGSVFKLKVGIPNFKGMAAFITSNVRFYRGSVRYVFHFGCSPNVTARFMWRYGYPVLPVDDLNSNVPTGSFEIRGGATHEVVVPYLNIYRIMENSETGSIANLDYFAEIELYCTQAPTQFATGVTSGCYVYVTEAFCDDFQAFSITGRQYEPVVGQSSLREMHHRSYQSEFATKPPKVAAMREVKTIEELMSRWSTQIPNVQPDFYRLIGDLQGFKDSALVDQLSSIFLFQRGSMDIKEQYVGFDATTRIQVSMGLPGNGITGAETVDTIVRGTTIYVPSIWPIMEYNIPMLSNIPIKNVNRIDCAATNVFIVGPAVRNLVLKRAGPDYQVFTLNRLLPFNRWNCWTQSGWQ